MFERETRREKILEARNKEIRLKEKTKGILGLGGAVLVPFHLKNYNVYLKFSSWLMLKTG